MMEVEIEIGDVFLVIIHGCVHLSLVTMQHSTVHRSLHPLLTITFVYMDIMLTFY